MLENFKNLYEVRKNARFLLGPYLLNRKPTFTQMNYDIYEILNKYENVLKNLKELLYYENSTISNTKKANTLGNIIDFSKLGINIDEKNEKFSINNKEPSLLIRIKFGWLEKFFTKEWHENKDLIIKKRFDKKKQIEIKTLNHTNIGNVKFLKDFFQNFFKNANEYYNNLSHFIEVQDFEKKRKSDIKLLLQEIQSRENLYKIYHLFEGEYIEHKNDNSKINEIKKELSELKKIINNYIENCKISESFGAPVEHMSLNYYTRRKTQKEYEDIILLKKKLLDKPFLEDLGELYGIKNENIDSLYNEMKIFKANQKSAFLELLQKQVSFLEFKNTFDFIDNSGILHKDYKLVLFDDLEKDKFEEMKLLTKKIEQEEDKQRIKEIKNKRGKYFIFHCKKYKKFCENYQQVAMEYGKRRAEVLSLQREKIGAEKERGYSFFSKDHENNFYINTFSFQDSKDVYDFSKNHNSQRGEISCYSLNSITLRALEKLCFSKKSTFRTGDIIKRVDKKFLKINESNNDNNVTLKNKSKLIEEGILIDFFVEILNKQNTLGIKFKSNKSLDFFKYCDNISDFEILLKQETYIMESFQITEEDFKYFLEKYNGNSYKIIFSNNEKSSFESWWKDFWRKENQESDYVLRINPELMISFRKGNPERFPKNHRKGRDSFLLTLSFSHSSDKNYIDSAFIKDEDRKENICDFNKSFNEKYSFDYIYGIDKGIKELVTLGVFKKGENGLEKVHISGKISIYKITEKGLQYFEEIEGKKRFLSKNVSYFLKDLGNSELFEKLDVYSCLGDLTYAKLIKGNIILNADIFTTLNLYKTTAKRFINEAFFKGEIRNNKILFNDNEKYFYFEFENRGKIGNKTIFYWKEEFNFLPYNEDFSSLQEEMQFELENYLKNIENSEEISMQNINNYKNAISANIVGIISELQKYFNGYICYETLNEKDFKRKGLNTFIGNVVNEKIYNKFVLSKEVPPILKKFRTDIGEKQILQHGKIIYVNEKNTSSACPLCNEKLLKINKEGKIINKDDKEIFKLFGHLTEFENSMHHLTDEEYNNKYSSDEEFKKNHINDKGKKKDNLYNAGKIDINNICDYHMEENCKGFDFIKSGDDLATYNIAKKAKEYLENLIENKNQ